VIELFLGYLISYEINNNKKEKNKKTKLEIKLTEDEFYNLLKPDNS